MYSWKDKFADWWNRVMVRLDMDSLDAKHTAVAVGISLILVGLIVGIPMGLATGRLTNQWDMATESLAALEDDMEFVMAQQQANYAAINATLTRLLADQWDAITDYQSKIDDDLLLMKADILALYENNFAYVAGNFSDYELHAKSAAGGQFTANVHLVYSGGVGNMTDHVTALGHFYASVNWTLADVPAYQCMANFNGAAWTIVEVIFNVGVFDLLPSIELVMPVNCVGLNSTWQPAFAYADIYRLP